MSISTIPRNKDITHDQDEDNSSTICKPHLETGKKLYYKKL